MVDSFCLIKSETQEKLLRLVLLEEKHKLLERRVAIESSTKEAMYALDMHIYAEPTPAVRLPDPRDWHLQTCASSHGPLTDTDRRSGAVPQATKSKRKTRQIKGARVRERKCRTTWQTMAVGLWIRASRLVYWGDGRRSQFERDSQRLYVSQVKNWRAWYRSRQVSHWARVGKKTPEK